MRRSTSMRSRVISEWRSITTIGRRWATLFLCWSTWSRPAAIWARNTTVPAVVNELMKAGKIHAHALTVNGRSLGENCAERPVTDHDVIRPYKKPLKDKAGFLNLKGNLFDSAIMKTSVISDEFRKRYLSN